MTNVAGDALYEVSYRSSWGAEDGPFGHVVIRRLDDHEIVAEIPASSEEGARTLLAHAEAEVRGPAVAFEHAWRIGPDVAADPGPDSIRRGGTPEGPAPRDGERVAAVDDRITVLPDPADVFVADQAWLARVLHPLVSIDLTAVDPAWGGRVHVLSPVEPEDGLLGEAMSAHANDFAGVNWLSFHVDDDGRWRFLGDRRLFEIEDAEARGLTGPTALYAEAEAELAGTSARWHRSGALVPGDVDEPARPRDGWGAAAVIDRLGGDPGHGNWTGSPPPPAFTLDTTGDVPVLRLADGRPFRFVAATAGYPWRNRGADQILLFFEPRTRTAALTFDWS